MICRKCNSQIPEDAVFCPECGEPIEIAQVNGNRPEYGRGYNQTGEQRCPVCGTPFMEGERFCQNCGNPLPQMNMIFREEKQPEKKRSKGKWGVVIAIFCGVLFVGGAAAASYFGYQLLKGETETEDQPAAVVSGDVEESRNPAEESTENEQVVENEEETPEEPVVEEPVYDETEGGIHRYEFVIQDCGWNQAYQDSLQKGGYLVRINSQAEYDAILQQIEAYGYGNMHFYLGGRKADNENAYYWVDENNMTYGKALNNNAEVWCNGAWMAGEPSFVDPNTNVSETYLNIFYYDGEGRWVWNDAPENIPVAVPAFSQKTGYIIEYEN